MTPRKAFLAFLIVVGFSAELYAQPVVAASPLRRYPEIRVWFYNRYRQAQADSELLCLFRETVAHARYAGTPMLRRMFRNFEPGAFNLSPRTPGLPETVIKLASDNPYVVKGHARTLVYGMTINDDRFKVIGFNLPRVNPTGSTDADIVFRHKLTGKRVRMEVKDLSPVSQRANLHKIQRQIRKMADDALRTGEMQVWANRREVIPEVRDFAERHGIWVEERLRTGKSNLRPGERRFQDFLRDLDKELRLRAKYTAIAGGAKVGIGAYLAYQAIRQLEADVSTFGGTRGDWLRIAEHGSTLLVGGGFGIGGAAQLARQMPAFANSARLVSLTRWGGRLGWAGMVLAEGFLVGQHLSGELTSRQFWHGQGSLVGGLAGGAAGGFVGFKAGWLVGGAIGSIFGPGGAAIGASIGATLGAIGGGVAGGYIGTHLGGSAVEHIYRLKDEKQHERYVQFLLKHYQSQSNATRTSY